MSEVKIINIAEMTKREEEAIRERNLVCDELLNNIKARKEKVESLVRSLRGLEPELVYRFYHQILRFSGLKTASNSRSRSLPKSLRMGCR